MKVVDESSQPVDNEPVYSRSCRRLIYCQGAKLPSVNLSVVVLCHAPLC